MSLIEVAKIIDIAFKIVALILGSSWTLYKIKQYRELKKWIQFDINSNIIKLSEPEKCKGYTWSAKGERKEINNELYTHAIEVDLVFTNKGKTQIKLYNIEVFANTMRDTGDVKVSEDDGHLVLKRLYTSGNIVPVYKVPNTKEEKSSFYYIEPGVQQSIKHLFLIPEPREFIQVAAQFSLEDERIFPKIKRKKGGLFPHTVSKIFSVKNNKERTT